MIQTIILSFAPIVILLVQNGFSFYELMEEKQEIIQKSQMVSRIFLAFFRILVATYGSDISCTSHQCNNCRLIYVVP